MDLHEFLEKESIRELRYAYSACIDGQDYGQLATLFTEDAVCEFGMEFGGNWVGRETIATNYRTVMATYGGPFEVIHVVTNPLITLTGPYTARGRWYLLDLLHRQQPGTPAVTAGGETNPLLYTAIYEDEYRKVEGRWLFSRIRIHLLWPLRTLKDASVLPQTGRISE